MTQGVFVRIGIAILIVIVCITALRRGLLAYPESVLIRAVTPISRATVAVRDAVGGSLSSFLRVRRLSRTVRILEEEAGRLQALVARMEGVEKENAALREQLKLLPRAKTRLITADVTSRTTDGLTEGLVINRGARDGIQTGHPVIVSDGILVGRIQRVESESAIVALLSDSSFRAAGITSGGAEGLVRGVRGINLVMETIPRTVPVYVGDGVVTSGSDGLFPRDLLVGTIQSVEAPENDIFQSAQLTSPITIRNLRFVSILLTP